MLEIAERIRSKFEVRETGCWEWTGCVTSTGYGRVWDGKRAAWAHRVVYEAVRGAIPEGLVLDHLCRNRRCVNPSHLDPVTDRINTLRGDCPEVTRIRHRAKRYCKRGHPLFGPNVYEHPSGRRVCRICHAIHKATYKGRHADVLLKLANGGTS